MPDGTLAAIDRLFDFVDQGVDHVARILDRGKQTTDRHRKRPAAKIIKAAPSSSAKSSAKSPASSSTKALVRRPKFYIVEAITSAGETEYVVTDGGNARTACPSRRFAEQILDALEKAL